MLDPPSAVVIVKAEAEKSQKCSSKIWTTSYGNPSQISFGPDFERIRGRDIQDMRQRTTVPPSVYNRN